jgi:virginiamycin A acetyltransferase
MPILPAPDPNQPFPLPDHPRVCFLKPVIQSPKILVGEYTYYDDPVDPSGFERNVLYHFEEDRLVIGKFCAIATGVKFIMNGANHKLDAISTYPFPIFGAAWAEAMDELTHLPSRGDTVIGNDVWIGFESLIMPGVHIGDGAIIAARSVVTRDVPPYTIVGGNPAQIIRQRFSDAEITTLLTLRWWDWPIEHITRHVRAIMGDRLEDLMTIYQTQLSQSR